MRFGAAIGAYALSFALVAVYATCCRANHVAGIARAAVVDREGARRPRERPCRSGTD